MDNPAAPISWTPLARLHRNFTANIPALQTRYPALAETLANLSPRQTYFILPSSSRIQLGVAADTGITALPFILPPETALDMIKKLCPAAVCNQPVLVAGEDLGWLWNGLYQLPCDNPAAPGHRSPLFFLINQIERLWVLLHLHDWRTLLADPRVRLFVGPDAFDQFRQSLLADPTCPWPKLSVRVDQSLWAGTMTLDEILRDLIARTSQKFFQLQEQLRDRYATLTPRMIAARLTSGQPLKILGITSRYTTFLQYSMRDWLAAFEGLGHRTHLLIEGDPYQLCNTLAVAAACDQFKPDLIVIIDHYRRELGGMPEHLPVVMWVQDVMPNIYRPEAAAAQGPSDYVLGFAYEKLRLVHELGYPSDRYLTTTIGMNPARFAPRPADAPELARYACDVSFVTHASVPADQIVKEQIDRGGTPEAKRLLGTIFEQMKAVYDAGGAIVAPPAIRRIIDESFIISQTQPTPELIQQVMDLFYMRVNNALFRHQSLHWLAEMGIDLRIYGRGWENNPAFKRFARGVADNEGELALIYQASRINLQASPLGNLHQRVMEGLAAGGFFIMRRCDGDIIGRHYARLWDFCQRAKITTDRQLQTCDDPQLQDTLRQAIEIHHCDPFAGKHTFMQLLQTMHECDYICSAGCVWGDDYDQTSFNSKTELETKVARFLAQPMQRQRLSQSMLRPVLDRFTYEKTSSRLLAMIAADQARAARQASASPDALPLVA